MIRFGNKNQCSGCTACANSCPYQAIRMQPDRLGFCYPVVDETVCTDCGICEAVCPFHPSAEDIDLPLSYAVRHRDMQQVAASQSGAAFIALSDWVLEQGGIVYGVGYAEGFCVVHKRAVTSEERDEFRGSKYVQSDLGSLFLQIKTDLQAGEWVLFSGTPCQTAGLQAFIKEPLRERLLLVDVVCHGVASPFVWKDYLQYLEQHYKQKLVSVNFRDKKFGWHSHRESFGLADGQVVYPDFTVYQDGLLRPSCGVCPFAGLSHQADITMGDFWGIEKTSLAKQDDNKGWSLVLCHTAKGKTVFQTVAPSLWVYPLQVEDCLQPNLQHPTRLPSYHSFIGRCYRKDGLVMYLRISRCWKCLKGLAKQIKHRLV